MKKVSLSLLILVFLASSITLLLLESPLKYIFYFFEVALILTVYLSLSGNFKNIRLRTKREVATKLNYALLTISITLLVLTRLGLNSILNLICAIIVSFFLPGYVILRALKFHFSNAWVEWIVLAFVISLPISSLVYTLILFFVPMAWRGVTLAAAFLIISLVPIIRTQKSLEIRPPETNIDFDLCRAFTLVIVLAFIIFSIAATYPQMALNPGLDIARHYSDSLRVNIIPDLYFAEEPWFHFQFAIINILSDQSIGIFETSLAYLGLISVLAFYVMANTYLGDVDRRLPTLATMIWSLFSGFGWIYFLREKLAMLDSSKHYDLLVRANDKTYWDIGYGQGPWLWLWFRPLTVGFTLIFVLLYLLKREDISRRNFLFLFSLIVTTLGMVHIPELVLFVAFLFFMALVKPIAELYLAEASLSTSLGALAVIPLQVIYRQFFGITFRAISFDLIIGLFVIAIMSYLLIRKPHRPFPICRETSMNFLTIGFLLAYLALFATWLSFGDAFSVKYVYEIKSVPWLLYPVLLGIGGLLALPGLALTLKTYQKHPLILFACLFVASIIGGRTLTFFNVNFLNTLYWERRVIPLVYSASAVLASLALVKTRFGFNSKQLEKFAVGILVAFVVINGFISTSASIEFWINNNHRWSLTEEENDAIAYLSEADPRTSLLTVTERSRSTMEYVPFGWIIDDYRNQLWPSKYPEIPLSGLSSIGGSAVIYLHERDLGEVTKKFSESYIVSHLLNLAPEIYSNAKVKIYDTPRISPPSSNSNVVLVVPKENHEMVRFAYDLLSLGNYNYTTVLASDLNMIKKADMLIFPTEDSALGIINSSSTDGKKIIVLNIDGYGQIASKLFGGSTMTFSMDPNFNNTALLEIKKTGVITGGDIATKMAEPTRFVVINTLQHHGDSLIIAEDNSTNIWKVGGMGPGIIGIPRLFDECELKASGNNSLAIEVGPGNYAQWQISTIFASPLNLTQFDFISFHWYGRGDAKKYVLQFNSENLTGSFWYSFTDTWRGWKKVLIPMWAPDGAQNLYNVQFMKVIKGNVTWSAINEVQIKLAGTNPNVPGTFYVDRFGFEGGRWITINIDVGGSPKSLTLYVNNSTDHAGYTKLFTLSNSTEMNVNGSWLVGSTQSRNVFGDRPTLRAVLSINNDKQFSLAIHVKLPPSIRGIEPSQASFMINPQIGSTSALEIESATGSVGLPDAIPVQPLSPTYSADFHEYRVLANYKGESDIPFAISVEDAKGFELTYLNVYPLIQKILLYNNESRQLYPILGELIQLSQVELPKYNHERRDSIEGRAAFTEAVIKGNIIVRSLSIVLVDNFQNLTISANKTLVNLANAQTLSFSNADFMEIKTTSAKINGGMGFYTNITIDAPIISVKGETPVALVLLRDGATRMLSGVGNLNITTNSTRTQVIARQPEIKIRGEGDFKEFYGYQGVAKPLRTLGQDLKINGTITFLIDYGDVFTITRGFNWQGSFTRSTPFLLWNEWNDVMNMIPWFIFISLLFATVHIFYASQRKQKQTEV